MNRTTAAPETKGYLLLVLHAHLPFIKHPEYPDFLEEDWLFEAIAETYIPLLTAFERLRGEGVPFKITMTLSPPLCEMLIDPLLMERFRRRLDKLCELSAKEAARLRNDGGYGDVARMHRENFAATRAYFNERCGGNLLNAFRDIQQSGHLEIITSAATHALLPLIKTPQARRAQIRTAVQNYRKHFGQSPAGIWLPECAYAPEIDDILLENGIVYAFVDSHGLINGSRIPRYATARPCVTPRGLAVFARDIESSKQVWSAKEGYPGDADYMEFYRDIGYDAEFSYIKEYLHSDGVRRNVGIKYHRITGNVELGRKEPYIPSAAEEKARVHAGDFLFNRQHQIRHLYDIYKIPPAIVSPYDAELFGHWWHEGPRFLEYFLRRCRGVSRGFMTATPSEYLRTCGALQQVVPSLSTWGDGGYFAVWINEGNGWMIRHTRAAEARMVELAGRFPYSEGVQRRALNQAARELLLAQSSDWQFILTTGTSVPYAQKRFKEHICRFMRLCDEVARGAVDETNLATIEERDSIFQEIDYHVYC